MKNDTSPKGRVGGDVLQRMVPLGELAYPKPKEESKGYRRNGIPIRNEHRIAKNLTTMTKKPHSPKKRSKLPKLPKIKSLEAKLKRLLYPLIKKRDRGVCISSGQTGLTGRNYQAGHFIKAELCNIIYRYDVRNINGQRSYDNLYLRGNAPAYRKGMIKKWGIKAVEEIEENYNKPLPMDFNEREYLMKLIEKYADKTAIQELPRS